MGRTYGISYRERTGKDLSGEKFCILIDLFEGSSKEVRDIEQKKRVVKEQIEVLEEFAMKYGLFFIDLIYKEYKSTKGKDIERLRSGNESDVYVLSDNGRKKIIKIVNWEALLINNTPFEFLVNKIILHNTLFPSTFYKFIGLQYQLGNFYFVLEQSYIELLSDFNGSIVETTLDEVDKDMERYGFEKADDTYVSNDYIISDLVKIEKGKRELRIDNVIKGEDCNLYYIDPIVEFNKKNRSYINFLS